MLKHKTVTCQAKRDSNSSFTPFTKNEKDLEKMSVI